VVIAEQKSNTRNGFWGTLKKNYKVVPFFISTFLFHYV